MNAERFQHSRWRVSEAVAWIPSLARELPYAGSVAEKEKKKKRKLLFLLLKSETLEFLLWLSGMNLN